MTRRMNQRALHRSVSPRAFFGGLLAVIAVLGLAAQASAQSAGSNAMITEQLERIPSGDGGVDQIMAPMVERLALSADQVGEIRPIVADLVSSFDSAKSKYETGEYTIMKMMMELNAQGEQAATLVEPHLTEAQLAEYQAMRAEQKARMMEERKKAMQDMMKARQAAAAGEAAQ